VVVQLLLNLRVDPVPRCHRSREDFAVRVGSAAAACPVSQRSVRCIARWYSASRGRDGVGGLQFTRLLIQFLGWLEVLKGSRCIRASRQREGMDLFK